MVTFNVFKQKQANPRNRTRVRALQIPHGARFVLIGSFAIAVLLGMAFSSVNAAFPGPNGKIIFETARDGNTEIYAMNADGTGVMNLTNNPANDKYPAVSPDGARITFISDRDGNEEIYVMQADGSAVTRLTNDSAVDRDPAWSPQGNRLVFASLRNSPWKIFAMDVADLDHDGNGDNLQQLTNNVWSDYTPAWSPDGTQIAFGSDHTGYNQIFVMNADGTNPIRLTNDTFQNHVPNWSPDGSRLVFVSTRSGNYDIYTMDPVDLDNDGNGDNQVQLTSNGAWNFAPVWSPDGAKLAFQSNRTGEWEIFVMNADASAQINLSNNSSDDVEADWGVAIAPPLLDVLIDIKPGNYVNTVHPNSKELLPVAILTTNTFNVNTVDPTSVRLGPNNAPPILKRHLRLIDVDHDGDRDLVLWFRTNQIGILCGDTELGLTGMTLDGQAFTGADSIRTVGCKKR